MKIAMIVDNPFTEKLPYPKRVYYEAKSLINKGYDVTIYCKFESDLDIPKEEIKDKIKIKRYFNCFLGTTVLIDKYLSANIELFNNINEQYDVYHCHDTNTWPIGYILSKRDNAKLVCETHEYFPDYICSEWHNDNFKYELTKMLVVARGNYIRYADKVISVSNEMAEQLKIDYKLKELPTVIYNTRPIEKSIINNVNLNTLRKKYNIEKNIKIILFQGLVEHSRGVDIAINLMQYINNSVLVIAGQCNDSTYMNELKELINKIKVDKKVIFTGFLPSDKLLKLSYDADFLIYLGKKVVKNMELTIPNKFFDYIMSGKPIIISNLYSLSEIVKKEKIGVVLDIDNDENIIGETVNNFVNNSSNIEDIKKKLLEVQYNYCWEQEEKKLYDLYEKLF
ncbi:MULTISPECIES: glycosyltransferase [unclassified Clostridium]|uniref:glycosyltransferase n=1 Tax=unclassified Clostridium TaxID=2614128 RepID=UPI001D313D19|nr:MULTISPECIES: glycosyltransferase [unclassified Clostridium]MBN1044498.1 glycosyltransferase [Clostridium botulinum]